MATRVNQGKYLDFTPVSAVSAGDVVVRGELVTIADADIISNGLGAVASEGLYNLAKNTGEAMLDGELVYWDDGADEVTTTAAANKVIGWVIGAELAAAATVNVKLGR